MGLPVILPHAGRHAWSPCDLWAGVDGDIDGAGRPTRAGRSQPAAADVPEHVLALPRYHLDRCFHLCLSDGNAAMSADTHVIHADHAAGHAHGSLRRYLIGFGLSVVLPALPFWLVIPRVPTSPPPSPPTTMPLS